MGITMATARLSNLQDPARLFEQEFVVDTGAVSSFAPADKLAAIGVTATRTKKFRLADGSIVRRGVGDVFFEIAGERASAAVVFGESADEALLGAVTLESLGLAVDPVSRRLFPVVLLAVGARPA
ncbi:MAG: aspartyl protease [Myxococcota bacterium]